MGVTFSWGWEIPFMQWLQSFETGVTTALAKFFSMCGGEYILILILGFCYWCINKDLGRKVSIAMAGSMVYGCLLKGIALRRRPYMDHEEIKCIRAASPDKDIYSPVEQGYSLPSLRASMSCGTYGTLAKNTNNRITKVLAFVMPFLIGLSGPFLGVHYPTDILAGWALGVITLLVLGAVEKKFGYKAACGAILVIGAAGLFYCRDMEFFTGYGVTVGLTVGFWFEERFVGFEMPKRWWQYILRPLLGALVFLAINTLLKLPLKNTSLAENDLTVLLYRTFRYAVGVFITLGVYPLAFRLTQKLPRRNRRLRSRGDVDIL